MKKLLFIALLITSINSYVCSQVITHGPEIENKEDRLLTKILDGDSTCFFTYRLNIVDGVRYLKIEKYDKATMNVLYSENIADNEVDLNNIFSVGNKLYFFYHYFSGSASVLYFKEVSADGKLMPDKGLVAETSTDDIELKEVEIIQNEEKTKFGVRASYINKRTGKFQIDFMVINAISFLKESTKTIKEGDLGYNYTEKENFDKCYKRTKFWGLCMDKNNTIYYGFNYIDRNPQTKVKLNNYKIIVCPTNEEKPGIVEIGFEMSYKVQDISITPNNNNEVVFAGFFQEAIKKSGPDEMQHGVFGYTINAKTRKITANVSTDFDEHLMKAMNSCMDKAKEARYKVDYSFLRGGNVFIVGEMYGIAQDYTVVPVAGPSGGQVATTRKTTQHYRDVVIAKYNVAGRFEWIKSLPLKTNVYNTVGDNLFYSGLGLPPFAGIKNIGQDEIKEYVAFATDDKIYILNNEQKDNLKIIANPKYKPGDLRYSTDIPGTNFVYSSISIDDGKMAHNLIFQNKPFCFAASPYTLYSEQQIFLDTYHHIKVFNYPIEFEMPFLYNKDGVFVYTHQKGKDRFSKVKFD